MGMALALVSTPHSKNSAVAKRATVLVRIAKFPFLVEMHEAQSSFRAREFRGLVILPKSAVCGAM
jgi:hypothetical protein